jgi:2,3-dihydroxyphenylpropionate 1,2-dioxygenase
VAQLVGGVVASHSTLMNTDFDRVRDRQAATSFRDALHAARDYLAGLKPDALLCIGSNHFRGFFLDMLPAFSLGVGQVIAAGEGGTPEGPLPTDTSLARHLLEELAAHDVDVAFSIRMTIDHGITHAVQHLSPGLFDVPVIPLVINIFAPPLPSVARCAHVGELLRAAVSDYPEDIRVAVIGSGGMSHELPWPDWRAPVTPDDAYLVEAWLNGRSDWKRYEVTRRSIIRGASANISPEFDRRFLAALRDKDVSELVTEFGDLERQAGNGGAELRNWIAARSAVGPGPVDVLGYWPIDEWLTGMGVATLGPAADASDVEVGRVRSASISGT